MNDAANLLTFFLRSLLVEAKHWEDGSTIHSLVWFVVAEDGTGRRWAHFRTFEGPTVGCSTRDVAPAVVSRLLATIEEAAANGEPPRPKISRYWERIDPAYGSVAYQKDEARQVFREECDREGW